MFRITSQLASFRRERDSFSPLTRRWARLIRKGPEEAAEPAEVAVAGRVVAAVRAVAVRAVEELAAEGQVAVVAGEPVAEREEVPVAAAVVEQVEELVAALAVGERGAVERALAE